MTRGGRDQAAGHRTGIWAPLTSFVGRKREAAELIKLLHASRLVTITGPGGVGKTRLAVELAHEVADQFPDGVYVVGLGAVTDEARVPAEVAGALGIRQVPGRSPQDMLTEVLAAQRLLLVLDNCEHVLTAVAELCGDLLKSADDVRILATSREQLWVSGEARYRLASLGLPGSGEPSEIAESEAVALFVERARQAVPSFTLTPEFVPLAARVVARLDGMPLAIELAAARVEALGMAGLADRIDDALRLLSGKDVLAAGRHKSLVAVADWSYRLLAPPEQRVFRRLAVFPGHFTLEAAEAVAGPEAATIVLRLVDCSLVTPPRAGPDGRMRYAMLQTLRAYGLAQLKDAGEEQETAVALAGFALAVAEQASAELETRDRELDGLRWLDGEDATVNAALSWALERDPDAALRLATALGPWWRLHGRTVEGYQRLSAAVRHASAASKAWVRAQLWLGYLSQYGDYAGSMAHHRAVVDAGDARESADALVALAVSQLNYGRAAEAAEDARRALDVARAAGYPAGEAQALVTLSLTTQFTGDPADALDWARQAEEFLSADIPGWMARWCRMALTLMLIEAGELDSARRICADGLAQSRAVGDLTALTELLGLAANVEWLAGRVADVGAYLREAADIASRIGDYSSLRHCVDQWALVCAATGRPAEAVTLWAALAADLHRAGLPPAGADERGLRRQATEALQPEQACEAAERGGRMTLAAAVEFVIMLTAPQESEVPPGTAGELTGRERELVTLVAQGRTNAQIAAQLFISIRTVSSHLDRIRDKTGYRRRADLTRLALHEGLV